MKTKDNVISDYLSLKNKAIGLLKKNKTERCVKYLEATAKIGYKYNFRYCDDDLEDLIEKLGNSIINRPIDFECIPNKIIFFDSFANTKVLAVQYLRAIISWNTEVLYLTSNSTIDKDLLEEIVNYPKATVLIIKGTSFSEKLQNATKSIVEFKPQKVFLHFTPWDILGFALWSNIKSSERFLINLTDHAYWLGKRCLDYSIEFRQYGIQLSVEHRGIPKQKLLFQPYYPIQSSVEFKGFPIDTKNKVVAFSGSSIYKIYGKNFLFFKLIKKVLDQNDNLIFLFAGSGNLTPLKKFILQNKLQDKIILLGQRSDISEIFKSIDIYVNTYPVGGALMTQYAAMNNKPIIGYSDVKSYRFNDLEDFLGIAQKGILIRKTENEFVEYFNNLITNDFLRIENTNFTLNSILSAEKFNRDLKNTIENKPIITNDQFSNDNMDVNSIVDLYFDVENKYLKMHDSEIWSCLRFETLRYKPMILVKHLFYTRIYFKIHKL